MEVHHGVAGRCRWYHRSGGRQIQAALAVHAIDDAVGHGVDHGRGRRVRLLKGREQKVVVVRRALRFDLHLREQSGKKVLVCLAKKVFIHHGWHGSQQLESQVPQQ